MYDLYAICIFQWWKVHSDLPLFNPIGSSRTFSYIKVEIQEYPALIHQKYSNF